LGGVKLKKVALEEDEESTDSDDDVRKKPLKKRYVTPNSTDWVLNPNN
jgi:hypothetical protein